MNKWLADQKHIAFLGALLLAVSGWGATLTTWKEALTVEHFFGLLAILGSLLLSNAAKSLFVEGGSSNGIPKQTP
jgi:hypothetical protein